MSPRSRSNIEIELQSRVPKKLSFRSPKHKFTDIACLFIFLVFVLLLITVSFISFLNGDPNNLILPHDSQGNICGNGDYETKKYLLFFDLTKCLSFLSAINGCPTRQICVSKCPQDYAYEKIPGLKEKIEPFCDPVTKECPSYLIPSQPVFGRCVPNIISSLDNLDNIVQVFDPDKNVSIPIEAFDSEGHISPLSYQTLKKAVIYLKNLLNLKESYELIFEDFSKAYLLILAGIGIAAVICFFWIFALRFFIKPIIYFSFSLVLAVTGFTTYFSINEYLSLKKQNQTDFKLEFEILFDIDYLKNLKETWLALSIVFGIIFLVLTFITIFLRKQIKFSIAIIKEVSKAVVNIPSVLIWPVFPLIIQIIFIVYCLATSVYLASSGIKLYKVIDYSNNSFTTNLTERSGSQINIGDYCIPDLFYKIKNQSELVPNTYECFFYKFGFNTTLPIGVDSDDLKNYYTKIIEVINEYQWIPQAFVIFMLFWLMAFSVALNQMTLAGIFGEWFFTRSDKSKTIKKLPFMTLFVSFTRAIVYHLGTLAFGSLIIAIIKMLRVFLEYIDSKVKNSNNQTAMYAMKCLKCCLWCLEKFVKFLNRRVFIITATYSLNFCSAAKRAVQLITNNILRVMVLNKLTDFVLFISNLCITFLMAVLGFYVFTRKIPIDSLLQITPELKFYIPPLFVLIIGSYCVSKLFLDVFSFGVDTLLLCALIDFEENDGSKEKPYFMSKSLKNILKVKNSF